jgi:hypothetical protein
MFGCFRYPSFLLRDRGSLANASRLRVMVTIPLITVGYLLLIISGF